MFLLGVAGSCPSALGQITNGSVVWEGSTDGGVTWQRGTLLVSNVPGEVRVRSLVSWTSDPDSSFAGAQWDVTINGAGDHDEVRSPDRPFPFGNPSQTLIASRFGSTIKIDDSRDTLPPGQGTRGVSMSQPAPEFREPNFDNPAIVFTFTLAVDTTITSRMISMIPRAPAGNPQDRFVIVLGSRSSTDRHFPLMTIEPLRIETIPAPGVTVLLASGVAGFSRRRR